MNEYCTSRHYFIVIIDFDIFLKEENRWKMLQRHTVAREKLKIAYEQEILRTHANAKRLEENQPKPYSACMVLQAEFENQYELPSSQSRSTPDNKR